MNIVSCYAFIICYILYIKAIPDNDTIYLALRHGYQVNQRDWLLLLSDVIASLSIEVIDDEKNGKWKNETTRTVHTDSDIHASIMGL